MESAELPPLNVYDPVISSKLYVFKSCCQWQKSVDADQTEESDLGFYVRDRAWFVRLYGEIIPEL